MGEGRHRLDAVAFVLGIGLAIVVLAAAANVPAPGPASTLLAAGSLESVPGFHHTELGGNSTCGGSPCGDPGEIAIDFSVALQARLSGSFEAGAPIDLWVGNLLGMQAACGLGNPPPPCAPLAQMGPSYLYQSPAPVRSVDFGQMVFNFGGAGSLLPSGSWMILLINWSNASVPISISSAVTVSPVW